MHPPDAPARPLTSQALPGGNRALLQLVAAVALYVSSQILAALLTLPALVGSQSSDSAVTRLLTDPLPSTIFFVLYAAFSTGGYYAVVKFMAPAEHRYIFGAPGVMRELFTGAALGAFLMSLGVLVLVCTGVFRVLDVGWHPGLIAGIAMGLGAAFGEEALFRGTIYRLLEARLGSLTAILLTGATFGVTHAGNPGAGWVGGLAITVSAGLLLTASYTLTGRLWLPVGIHFAWNAVQAGVFGITVSGTDTGRGLFHSELIGPAWLSGGPMGIEGSVPLIAFGLLAGAIMVVLCFRSGRWRPSRLARQEVREARCAREVASAG